MKTSGSRFGWIGMGFSFFGVVAGCAGPVADRGAKPARAQTAVVATARPTAQAVVASTPISAVTAPALKNVAKARPSSAAATMNLKLKRLVITQAVKDREPEATPGALPSDGSAIFAFAELSNADGSSGNVRITFERKGGAERVGDVLLPVPGDVPRYRTWAFTRFIRVPGVWEAVLWSEAGTELGRTSFEVAPS